VLLLISVSLSIPVTSINPDEMPKEWFGKRKVIENFGKYSRFALIHYKSEFVGIDDPDNDKAEDGYNLSEVWWNLSKYPNGIPYIINPTQAKTYGLSVDKVISEVKSGLESWDIAIDLSDYEVDYVAYPDFKDVGSKTTINYNINLFNDKPTIDYKAKASTRFPDYKNVITWGRAQQGVIAYAVIWYNSKTKEIVDADIVLNSYYKWGIADGDEATNDLKNKFDLRNIVTHESGHWCGLDDIYDSKYSAMTMYGFSSYGEEIKRSLEPGDIAGIQEIYKSFRS
jgi:hypothetical protein